MIVLRLRLYNNFLLRKKTLVINLYKPYIITFQVLVAGFYLPIFMTDFHVIIMAYSNISNEPDWPFAPTDHVSYTGPIQKSDLFKHFLLNIGNWGLNYVYHKYYLKEKVINKYKHTQTKQPSNIIIIGAVTSGLVGGYEPYVTVLEWRCNIMLEVE